MAHHEDLSLLLARMEEAWNEGDAAAYARVFSSDAVYVNRSGAVWEGRPAIEEGHALALAGALAGTTLALRPIHVALPALTVAVACVDVQLASDDETIRAVTTLVASRDAGEWTIIAAHTSEAAPVH